MERKKIIIIGNYGATNVGDEAILASILENHRKKADFTVLSYNPKETKALHNVNSTYSIPFGIRSILHFSFFKTLKEIKKSKAVILGGGGLIFDTKLYAVALWAWQILWCKILKKPIFLYGIGIGPINTKIGKLLSRFILKSAKFITVRDKESYNTAKKLEKCEQKIRTTSDPVLLLNIPYKKAKKNDNRTKKVFLISIRKWKGINLRKINKALKNLNYEKIFISMQKKYSEKDKINTSFSPLRLGIHASHGNWKEITGILKKGDIAVGMRLHFCIFSTMLGIPTIAVSYSPKVRSFMENIGQNSLCIEGKNFNEKILDKKINYILKNYDKISLNLHKEIKKQKKRAERNVRLFNDFLRYV